MEVNGVYDTYVEGYLTGKQQTSSTNDGASPTGDGTLMSVAGDPSVWKVGDTTYLIHETTATDGTPIRLAWEVSPNHVEGLFGPGQKQVYDQTLGSLPADVLMFGNADELANMTEDPITTWRNTLETESKTQPWLLDSDYQAKSLMAVLEGRSLSESEIQQTRWWQENTTQQRSWMKLFHSDPLTAQQRLEDGRILALDQLSQAGIDNPPEELVNFMSDKLIMGDWSQTYFTNQVRALSDPQTGIAVDSSVSDLLADTTLDTTRQYELEVNNVVKQWLGPNFGNWDQGEISRWAGEMRNNPDAMVELVEVLKDQRLALFPNYDRNATYETIASPWRQFVNNQWGQFPDEDDPMFHNVINMNDAAEAGKLLTKEGLNRGIQTVENRVSTDLMNSFGGSAR